MKTSSVLSLRSDNSPTRAPRFRRTSSTCAPVACWYRSTTESCCRRRASARSSCSSRCRPGSPSGTSPGTASSTRRRGTRWDCRASGSTCRRPRCRWPTWQRSSAPPATTWRPTCCCGRSASMPFALAPNLSASLAPRCSTWCVTGAGRMTRPSFRWDRRRNSRGSSAPLPAARSSTPSPASG